MTEEKKLEDINRTIWKTVDSILAGDQEVDELYATGAVLLQTAIELYTVALEDEAIEKILNITVDDIPELRERMKKRLGERVLH